MSTRQTKFVREILLFGLQLLQKARQHAALQADAVEPVLAASFNQDGSRRMTAPSFGLLAMLKQTSGEQWPTSVRPATASLLAEALLQEPDQRDVIRLFEARCTAKLVWQLCDAAGMHSN